MKKDTLEALKNDIDNAISKGKGYSIYNSTIETVSIFEEIFKEKALSYQTTTLSSLVQTEESINKDVHAVIVYQDLDESLLLSNIERVVNNVIYPLWFHGVSTVFISKIDKSSYLVNEIDSSLIHTDFQKVTNLLLMEQLNNLLDLTNSVISTPGLMEHFNQDIRYTPIERIFSEKLNEKGLSYESQVKIGRFYVDFLVQIKNAKVIVECDGRDYHDAKKDVERDKELRKEGYKIFRFSGSKIYNECDKCIDEIFLYSKNQSSKYVLEDLNDEQMIAVNHISGPMRVLAPAGSGKTKTLVNRVVQLINKGIASSEIVALAFNKKAGEEMTERLNNKFGLNNVTVKTFHSFGNDIVKNKLKWKFDGDKMSQIERNFMEQSVSNHTKITYMRNKDPLEQYLSILSKVKNDLLPISEMIVSNEDNAIDFEPIFFDFLKKCSHSNFYTYDDMLYVSARILLSDSQLRRKVQQMYKYVLVDEFQDLNKVQLLLLQILCLPENNLFIVGDDDQMIYGFRGAELRPLLEFNNRYSITADQVLRVNYRSCGNIVKHSKWLIDHNEVRVYKDIVPFSAEQGDVSLFIGEDLTDQANHICRTFLEKKNDANQWSDFAILIRHHQYKDLLRIALFKHGIPTHSDEGNLFHSKVGECIFAYLSVIFYPDQCEEKAFKQILNYPNKYFTNDFVSCIKKWDDFINIEGASNVLRAMDVERHTHFVNKVVKMSQELRNMSVSQIINTIINEFELVSYFKDNSNTKSDLESTTDSKLLDIFVSIADYFDSIDQMLSYWGEQELIQEKESVFISTVHRTKGNEYMNVAYFNVINTVTTKSSESEMEEERRIAYVAVTRPKKSLLVTSQKGELSPFIRELFLNPEFHEKSEEELNNILPLLQVKINIEDVKVQEIELKENVLIEKYPELQGRMVLVEGWFKGIKSYVRKRQIDSAVKQLKELQLRKQLVMVSRNIIQKEKTEIIDEMEIRRTIASGETV